MGVKSPLPPWVFDPRTISTRRPTMCLKQIRLRHQLLTTAPIKGVTVDWIQHKEEGTILEIFQQLPPAGKVTGRGNWVPNSHEIFIYLLENKIGILYEEMACQVLRSPSQGPK